MKQDEVKHVAKLARLKLTAAEVRKFQQQLSEILIYVDQLKKVKTENIETTSQVTGLENIFRKDKQTTSLTSRKVLSGTLGKQDNFFKIKALFER